MKRLEWYRNALQSLGSSSLIRLQLQKQFASSNQLSKLTSKICATRYLLQAIRGHHFNISTFGELTICFGQDGLHPVWMSTESD